MEACGGGAGGGTGAERAFPLRDGGGNAALCGCVAIHAKTAGQWMQLGSPPGTWGSGGGVEATGSSSNNRCHELQTEHREGPGLRVSVLKKPRSLNFVGARGKRGIGAGWHCICSFHPCGKPIPSDLRERSIAMTRAAIPAPSVLVLAAQTAEELMVPNPISLREDATIPEAVALMTDRGFSAAPVIDEAGHPIGVLSRTDVLIHEREQVRHALPAEDFPAERWRSRHEGFSIEITDSTLVRDIMTPTLFTVNVNTSAADVVKRMCDLKVHQLFVVDNDDALVGVISALNN